VTPNSQLLDEKIHTLWQNPLAPHHATTHTIPTAYTGEDIEWVAKEHSLSVRELIQLHTAPTYLIAMLGFKPYFPYLIGLNQQLITPRRSSPRINTPHGSVAIGGAQTGIYTVDSPGGWHIIGQTSFRDFNQFKPGDFIIFQEI
jgi:KipI family sensor histidine kinase inhibitor